ncbi:hypothetical protein L810_6232 [Burkholderia sp. AU4i]|nr:hypothetical protein L810_6232 [Burkholderia sp. AU4i]
MAFPVCHASPPMCPRARPAIATILRFAVFALSIAKFII